MRKRPEEANMRTRTRTQVGAAAGVLLAALFGIPAAQGVGTCRHVDCEQGTPPTPTPAPTPGPKVPKKQEWNACKEQDTFQGCCTRYHGMHSADWGICCWEGTPSDRNKGSTTVIKTEGGDTFTPDTGSKRSCSSQGAGNR
jgi:hypothetical protein